MVCKKEKKKVGCASFFSTPLSVFGYPDKTLFLVFDILLQVIHNIQYATKTIQSTETRNRSV